MAVKNVCFKCVIDPFLGGQIQRKGTSNSCSLCASKRKCIPLTEIVTRVEKILQLYIYEGVDFRWSGSGAEQYQKGECIDIWVSEVFGCDNIEPIVRAVCRELSSYSDDMNYSGLPFRPDDIGHQWGEFQEGMKQAQRLS
ncbi:hypothetical protein ACU680_01815 [Pseudomonas koreensis]